MVIMSGMACVFVVMKLRLYRHTIMNQCQSNRKYRRCDHLKQENNERINKMFLVDTGGYVW